MRILTYVCLFLLVVLGASLASTRHSSKSRRDPGPKSLLSNNNRSSNHNNHIRRKKPAFNTRRKVPVSSSCCSDPCQEMVSKYPCRCRDTKRCRPEGRGSTNTTRSQGERREGPQGERRGGPRGERRVGQSTPDAVQTPPPMFSCCPGPCREIESLYPCRCRTVRGCSAPATGVSVAPPRQFKERKFLLMMHG